MQSIVATLITRRACTTKTRQIYRSRSECPLAARLRAFAEGWQWWQVVVQVGIPMVLVAVIWTTVRRQQKASRKSRQDNK